MQDLGLGDAKDYARRIATDTNEFQRLIDDLCVPETWFFRGGELFDHLVARVREEIQTRGPREQVVVRSIPCSTGEEPYSLVMSLLDGEVPTTGWRIEGMDASTRHIERAKAGRYNALSFRQMPGSLRERFFHACGEQWEIAPAIRSLVRFRSVNLFDPSLAGEEGSIDLVLCRNLFIYLHAEARERALDLIHRWLRPGGWLCVGHAEPLDSLDHRFRPTGPPECFIYEKSRPGESRPGRGVTDKAMKPPVPNTGKGGPVRPVSLPAHRQPKAALKTVKMKQGLEQARLLADAGDLDLAMSICERELSEGCHTPEAFSLMGVIFQARHELERAEQSYQRALYLSPDHVEALTHLMLLVRGRGDIEQAERLKRRLDRVTDGDAP
jgi:chemotaxis protein methyltransferase WspC